MHQHSTQALRPREKSKRPQLSCNPCRARKVKCDRIQPCTACSLHQIAELCQFDLSEAERQPILQAEALKDRDKQIVQLRQELASLRGGSIKLEPADDVPFHSGEKLRLPPRMPRKISDEPPKQLPMDEAIDNIYFGSPGLTSVVEEFAHLAFDPKNANLTHTVPRGTDLFAFQSATSHPFPTLWSAKDDTSTLIKILPPHQDLFFYLDHFQQRAQACSFPHVPDQCTTNEVRRFLENLEHNAALHPDMLALLFATLAQGLQDGVYDKDGGKWAAGSVEAESKKGDVYIAAAMQCLRLVSFMSRPTLLVIEALVLIGPYLTNSGKFLDASALFGTTVRLAQSIGLHRDSRLLNPPAPLKEIRVRKNLWWWMLHMDQQYSMALGRPLAISSMGDCPPPEPLVADPVNQSLSNYISQFSILGRQILSAAYLTNDQIDRFSDELLGLYSTLPELIQFDLTWLDAEKPLPAWPLDAQAGMLHAKTHNFLVLLNRQRLENIRRNSDPPLIDIPNVTSSSEINHPPRGRDRVLESCRSILVAFEFFQTRVRAALICWTMGQMAFNAAMILLLSMLETGNTQDLIAVQHAYSAFLEMNKLGIHRLAGQAVERLGIILKEFRTGDPANETVMGHQGMMLLEDPGLQGSLPESYSPISWEMAGGADTPGMQRLAESPDRQAEIAQIARKRAGRHLGSNRNNLKNRKRTGSQRPVVDRRFSDGATPRPHKKKRGNRSTPNLTLLTNYQHNFAVAPHTTVKNEALFTPIEPSFAPFHPADSPATTATAVPSVATTPRAQQVFQLQHQPIPHLQHHSEHGGRHPSHFDFSNNTTPGAGTDFFDENFQTGAQHFSDFDIHGTAALSAYDHPPYSAPPFGISGDHGSGHHHQQYHY